MFITFLTDFGLEDDFVGTCHGVIKRIAPEVEIIDITHGISPQSVLQGALVLVNTLPFLPEGVHLAVVDPGVGSGRRALALRGPDSRLFVGPDNGLLVPAAEALGGIEAAHEISNREYALEPISSTFHGRDVFAPAAAHLAQGLDIAELGPSVAPDSLVRLELPKPDVSERRIRATCLYVDRFGNIQLNLKRGDLERFGLELGHQVELERLGDRYYAHAARTFADARPGEVILYVDAYENVALAISGGNAAHTFNVRTGDEIRIRPAG
ncbi:MAG TPA: SAM-dependent chlorinase/fluorinase [Gaiellaceae bacterium]|nr:SAM-dependent chlorinase/fluorinase [Gaiellaceae bacterium]